MFDAFQVMTDPVSRWWHANMRRSGDVADWQEFQEAAIRECQELMRLFVLAGAILFLVFWGWDWLIDARGAERTMSLRLVAAAVYLMAFALMSTGGWLGRHVVLVYTICCLAAPVFIVVIGSFLEGGHLAVMGGGTFILIIVAMVGPIDRIAIPLAIGVTGVLSISLLAVSRLDPDLAAVVAPEGALEIVVFQASVTGLVVVLARRDTLTNFRLFKLHREAERRAVTDPLTQALNRRGLEDLYMREIARQQRYKHPTALLLLDIDHFKRVNDTYGHPVGDEILEGLSHRVRLHIRDSDYFARVGGEEFVAVLTEVDDDMALESAERLRERIGREPFATSAGDLSITVSIGVRVIQADDTTLELALADADKALYRAKDKGRNRCEFATEPEGN